MYVVAGIKFLAQANRATGILSGFIEVDNFIEISARANPSVHSLPDLFTAFRCSWYTLLRHKRGANNSQAMRMAPRNDLTVAFDQFVSRQTLRPFRPGPYVDVID